MLKSGWHHDVVEVGGNITSFLVLCGLLLNCLLTAVCSPVEMAGKDELNFTRAVAISLQEKAREGESKQGGRVQMTGRERKGQNGGAPFKQRGGQKEQGAPSLILPEGLRLGSARGLAAGTHQPLLLAAGPPLGLPFMGWPSWQLWLMNMQSADTYAADQ